MEAILALCLAFVSAAVAVAVHLVQALSAVCALVVELMFCALTQGPTAASDRYKQRKAERTARARAKEMAAEAEGKSTPEFSTRQAVLILVLSAAALLAPVVGWVIYDRIQTRRIEETTARVQSLADGFKTQIKDDEQADPEPGRLNHRDAWRQPMELFVDKTLLGTLIVVRSAGQDKKPGTIDDILAVRTVAPTVKGVGRVLKERGMKALRKRVARMLTGGDEDQLPELDDRNDG